MALLGQWGFHAIAGMCSMSALIVACYQIFCHLKNYTSPVYQRYIVRIIFMVPLYAVTSFLSLLMPHNSIYFSSVRDCYEAFVIYNFLSLCLAYVGGPGSVEVKMNGYQLEPSWLYGTCCLPPLPVNGKFVRMCKQGALQFVLLKPPLAVLQIILYTQGMFHDGDWKPNDGFLWIAIIYNITYSVALYALLLFYLGTHELLAPFNPLLKFAMVKMVVFLTFWQSLLVSILSGVGALATTEDQKNLQNFLICVEMLPAAVGMLFAFPFHEYKGTEGEPASGGLGNVRHVISIHDVVSDTMHQFAPSYHDYVLYSNGGTKEAPKKVRTKTFVAVGHESANNVRAKDHMQANLLANMELGGNRQGRAAEGASPRSTADSGIQLQPIGKSDDPVYQMRGTVESDDDYYSRRSPQQDLEEGNAYFSADIDDPLEQAGRGHSVLSRVESVPGPVDDDEIFWLDEMSESSTATIGSHSALEGHRAPVAGLKHAGRRGHGRTSPQKQRLKLPPKSSLVPSECTQARQTSAGSQQQGGSSMQPSAAGRLKNWEGMQDIDLADQEPLK